MFGYPNTAVRKSMIHRHNRHQPHILLSRSITEHQLKKSTIHNKNNVEKSTIYKKINDAQSRFITEIII